MSLPIVESISVLTVTDYESCDFSSGHSAVNIAAIAFRRSEPSGPRLSPAVTGSNARYNDDNRTLYLAAQTGLYRIHLNIAGTPTPDRRGAAAK